MLTRSDYIEWLTRNYARVEHNLAASGTPGLSAEEVEALPAVATPDPWRALCGSIAALHGVAPDEAIACIGASQGLWLAYAAMLRPGDEVLVEAPTYAPLAETPATLGASVRSFAREPQRDFALDADRVCAMISPRTRVVAITELHNPSGARTDRAAIRQVAAALAGHGGWLFVDEIYAPFDRSDGTGIGCRTVRREAANIVTVSSLGKAFGLGAQRIGWVLGPPDVIARANVALRASTGDLPPAWARLALGAIAALPALASRAERLANGKAARVAAWVADRPRLSWAGPGDALFGLVRVAGAAELRPAIEAGIERHRVIVVPGIFFGMPDAFRLAWSLPEARLEPALERLDATLRDAELI